MRVYIDDNGGMPPMYTGRVYLPDQCYDPSQPLVLLLCACILSLQLLLEAFSVFTASFSALSS
jgi:hypothetical protein